MSLDFDASAPPLSLTRLEFNEDGFIASCDGDTDGVVISLRFDTPPKHQVLKAAALRARMPFLIDLEAWRLPYLEGREDKTFGIDAQTAIGRAVPLPLDPESLSSPALTQSLVRTSITAQVGAELSFAPDFQFRTLDDPWLQVNLSCLRQTYELAPRQPVAVWIHVTLETMLSGLLPFVAERYARELPPNTVVALTVSDIRPQLPPEHLGLYLSAVRAFQANGLRVIVDRATEVSIPAVACGAIGSMLGNRLYRSAPASPIYENDFNPKIPLGYFDGQRAEKVQRDLARRRYERGVLNCPSQGCKAVTATPKRNMELRLHAAHEIRATLHRARRLGAPGLRSQWREAKLKRLRGFAQALELAEARSEEA